MKKSLILMLLLATVLVLSGCKNHDRHDLVKTPAKETSCSGAGNTDYWTCVSCGKIFADEGGTREITIFDAFIPKLPHTPQEDDNDCTTELRCLVCTDILIPKKDAHVAAQDDGDCTTDILCAHCPHVMTQGYETHEGGEATCMSLASCTRCGTGYGDYNPGNHADNLVYTIDDLTHSATCTACSTVAEENADHSYINGLCACGMRKAHSSTLHIAPYPAPTYTGLNMTDITGVPVKTAWEAGDQLLISIQSHIFGEQYIVAVYEADGTWSVAGTACWDPDETPVATAWYAPGHAFGVDGAPVLIPGMQCTEYLVTTCTTGEDDLLDIDFAAANRDYAIIAIYSQPGITLTVYGEKYAPTTYEEPENVEFTVTTNAQGVAYVYGMFRAGGRIYVTDEALTVYGEYVFPLGSDDGCGYVLSVESVE